MLVIMPTEFQDLTKYSYNLDKELPNVLNVGWLGKDVGFPRGEVSSSLLRKIKKIVPQCSVNRMRGYQPCWFCRGTKGISRVISTIDGDELLLGAAELWVCDGSTTVFAAPDLIIHYIEEHHYLPPKSFLSAVETLSKDWDAPAFFASTQL